MNKLLIILFSIFIYQTPLTYALDKSDNTQLMVRCSSELQDYMNLILRVPEAKALITAIQKEGPIQVIIENTSLSNQFGAFWDPDDRIICIGINSHTTSGSIIGSILFELHNASVNSKIQHFCNLAIKGKIKKKKYIESMEYLEYINSLNAAKIAEKGVQMGLFPVDARLPTYSSFKEHFKAQQMSGHSDCFAYNYDTLSR